MMTTRNPESGELPLCTASCCTTHFTARAATVDSEDQMGWFVLSRHESFVDRIPPVTLPFRPALPGNVRQCHESMRFVASSDRDRLFRESASRARSLACENPNTEVLRTLVPGYCLSFAHPPPIQRAVVQTTTGESLFCLSLYAAASAFAPPPLRSESVPCPSLPSRRPLHPSLSSFSDCLPSRLCRRAPYERIHRSLRLRGPRWRRTRSRWLA